MDNIIYFVTGPGLDGMYGIAVIDQSTGDRAVASHFLENRANAEYLAETLNVDQRPVSEFCHDFMNGDYRHS